MKCTVKIYQRHAKGKILCKNCVNPKISAYSRYLPSYSKEFQSTIDSTYHNENVGRKKFGNASLCISFLFRNNPLGTIMGSIYYTESVYWIGLGHIFVSPLFQAPVNTYPKGQHLYISYLIQPFHSMPYSCEIFCICDNFHKKSIMSFYI